MANKLTKQAATEKVKATTEKAKATATKAKEEVKAVATTAKEKAVQTADTAKKTAVKTADATKETVVKTADATKKTAIKTVDTAKKAASKVATALVEETYFEFDGFQVNATDLKERIKEAYKAEGHRLAAIKSLQIYVNGNERRAYYVINNKAEGKFIDL